MEVSALYKELIMEACGLTPPTVLAARSDALIGETVCTVCGHQCNPFPLSRFMSILTMVW